MNSNFSLSFALLSNKRNGRKRASRAHFWVHKFFEKLARKVVSSAWAQPIRETMMVSKRRSRKWKGPLKRLLCYRKQGGKGDIFDEFSRTEVASADVSGPKTIIAILPSEPEKSESLKDELSRSPAHNEAESVSPSRSSIPNETTSLSHQSDLTPVDEATTESPARSENTYIVFSPSVAPVQEDETSSNTISKASIEVTHPAAVNEDSLNDAFALKDSVPEVSPSEESTSHSSIEIFSPSVTMSTPRALISGSYIEVSPPNLSSLNSSGEVSSTNPLLHDTSVEISPPLLPNTKILVESSPDTMAATSNPSSPAESAPPSVDVFSRIWPNRRVSISTRTPKAELAAENLDKDISMHSFPSKESDCHMTKQSQSILSARKLSCGCLGQKAEYDKIIDDDVMSSGTRTTYSRLAEMIDGSRPCCTAENETDSNWDDSTESFTSLASPIFETETELETGTELSHPIDEVTSHSSKGEDRNDAAIPSSQLRLRRKKKRMNSLWRSGKPRIDSSENQEVDYNSDPTTGSATDEDDTERSGIIVFEEWKPPGLTAPNTNSFTEGPALTEAGSVPRDALHRQKSPSEIAFDEGTIDASDYTNTTDETGRPSVYAAKSLFAAALLGCGFLGDCTTSDTILGDDELTLATSTTAGQGINRLGESFNFAHDRM